MVCLFQGERGKRGKNGSPGSPGPQGEAGPPVMKSGDLSDHSGLKFSKSLIQNLFFLFKGPPGVSGAKGEKVEKLL